MDVGEADVLLWDDWEAWEQAGTTEQFAGVATQHVNAALPAC